MSLPLASRCPPNFIYFFIDHGAAGSLRISVSQSPISHKLLTFLNLDSWAQSSPQLKPETKFVFRQDLRMRRRPRPRQRGERRVNPSLGSLVSLPTSLDDSVRRARSQAYACETSQNFKRASYLSRHDRSEEVAGSKAWGCSLESRLSCGHPSTR